ncbi:MAG: sugar transferase [Actinomycetota bacterium]
MVLVNEAVITDRSEAAPRRHLGPHERRQHPAEERRAHPLGDAAVQMDMVTSPDTPLPPFGRRAGDIKPLRKSHLAFRRTLDIVVAGTMIVVLSPLLLALALAVKATSRGPALFKHERVGRGGKRFLVLKFRTMKVGTHEQLWSCEEQQSGFLANDFKLSRDDSRITPIGRTLRRTGLDELPQLINILRGDMSLVGVRPLVPVELAMRPDIDQTLYCRLRPGVTGLWQTSGRSNVLRNRRIAMDRQYAAEWHPMDDLKILLRTPRCLFRTEETA